MPRIPLRAAAVASLLLLTAAIVSGERTHRTVSVGEAAREELDEESRAIEERARWYLSRHGDRGRIDPERRLAAVAAEYARWRTERDRTKGTKSLYGVGGTEWISLGPTNGAGRMTALAPHPTIAGTAYVGAAGGGVWKTTDGGSTWTPLTEGLHDLSVGALALAPSNPSIVYLGTGEGAHPSAVIPGIGFVKSTDGGATWILPDSILATQFYRILVHPTDPNELVVGTNVGAFRSTDGGATWTNVIGHDAYGEVPDIVRASDDPRNLYATTWCSSRACTFPAARVLKSTDGGVTWTDRSNGLPSDGRIGTRERTSLAISPSNSSVLYAARAVTNLFTTGAIVSHIYKTTDAGATWTDLASPPSSSLLPTYLGAQSWYDNALVVSPTNPDVLIAGGVAQIRTTDGGATFQSMMQGGLHPDCHDLKYQGSTLWLANDGGIWTSPDDGATTLDRNTGLVTRQYYALSSDRQSRTRIVAGSQDNGNVQRVAPGTVWRPMSNAGDGFQGAIHPLAPDIMWNTSQGVLIFRTSEALSGSTPHFRDISPPFDPDEQVPFFSLLSLDPSGGSTIYTGSTRLWRSKDGGDTWQPLPTTTVDGSTWNPDSFVTAIAMTPAASQALLVGKGDGIFRSDDGGRTWRSGQGVPAAGVTSVALDPRDPYRAYATFSTTTGPSLYRSSDGGLTWTASATGLPSSFAAQVIRVDPTDSTDLFCGTDVGVFRSTDRGATWSRFGTGLPAVSVHDVDIHEDGSLVRVATYGRGIWELAVPASGNSPPTAAIAAPSGVVTVTVGSSVDFAGTVADPDAGDTVAGEWFFSDDGTRSPLAGPTSLVRHVFRRAGLFPVALGAKDSHGARGSASVLVAVRELADSCVSPEVFPGSGPFPYTIRVDDHNGTNEPSDPTPSCFGARGAPAAYSTWFQFTPDADGQFELSTCGTDTVSVLSVFTGPSCGPYAELPGACKVTSGEDTTCGAGDPGRLVSFSAAAGQAYRILLSSDLQYRGGPVLVTLSKAATFRGLRLIGVTDSSGPTAGGSAVTLSGSGFFPGSTVAFGGTPATDVVVSADSISARTPAHAAGPVDVSVSVPGGATAVLKNGFRYDDTLASPCVPTPTSLCANANRFRVEARWRVSSQGQSGAGTAVALTADTGYFWFFSPNNIELVVKVVDGRPVNGKFWVFYGALSDVEYEITVTDLATGGVRTYANPPGRLSSVADTSAF